MLINVVIPSMAEQRTLLLWCFVILVSASVFVLPSWICVSTLVSVGDVQIIVISPLYQIYRHLGCVCVFAVKMRTEQL